MALNTTRGTICHMSEVTSGTSQSGRTWGRMNIMLEVPGFQGSIYKIVFQVGTDRIEDVQQFKVGDKVEVAWSIYAREYKDRWYNNVDLVSIKAQVDNQAPVAQKNNRSASKPKAAEQAPAHEEDPGNFEPKKDDLPF